VILKWRHDFLILVSDTTTVDEGLDNTLNAISSNFSMCFFELGEQKWKEKRSENKSISLFPGSNSLLKKEKGGKNSLHLLSTSMSGDFNWILYLAMR